MIRFKCPSCQAVAQAPDNLAGRRAKCQKCGKVLTVPSTAVAPKAKVVTKPARVRDDDDDDDDEDDDRPRKKSGSKALVIVGVLVVVLFVLCGGVGVAGYFIYKHYTSDETSSGSQVAQQSSSSDASSSPAKSSEVSQSPSRSNSPSVSSSTSRPASGPSSESYSPPASSSIPVGLTKSPIVLNCANRVQCMVLSPDGKLLAAGIPGANPGQAGHALVWELPEGKEKFNVELTGFMVTSMAFAPDGKTLAVGGQDAANAESGVRFIDVEGGKDKAQNFGGHVNVLAYDPNTGNLATGDEKNSVLISAPADGSRVRLIDGAHGGPFGIERLAFAAKGQVFITAGINAPNKFPTEIKGWETPTIAPLWTIVPFKTPVRDLAVSADGLTFAACATEGDQSLIKIFDAKTGKEQSTIKGPKKEIRALALAPEGKQVAGLYLDSIRVFDIAGGKEVSTCKTGHSAAGTGVLFTPDGSTLISASDDKTIKLWNRDALTVSASPPPDSSSSADTSFVTVKGAEVGTATGKGKRYFYKLTGKATATLIVDGNSQVLDTEGKPLAPDLAFKDGNMMDLKLKPKSPGVFIVIEGRLVKGQ